VIRFFRFLCLLGLLGSSQAQNSTNEGAQAKPEAVLFDTLPIVEAASLHAQSLLEAPASVTVITAEDIQQRGYRTLAEVLADVRGFFVSYDRNYNYVGVRGFSLPGDYNTRFLVLLNGHSLVENVFGSAGYFGQDFGLDLDLVKRIEIVRGPSSALYGSNGMFATINVITKSPVEFEPWRIVAETGSFGERKAQVSSSQYLGRGANLLISASVFNNIGQSLYFPEFDSPATNYGRAVDTDGEKGYHTFANLIWRNWSFLGYFNSREKLVPTGDYGTVFNDRGTKYVDGRGFLESAYQRSIGAEGELRWRAYYDQYRSTDRFDFPGGPAVVDGRQGGKGDWVGTQLTYRFRAPWKGFLTLGSEASWDLRALIYAYEAAPEYVDVLEINRRNRSLAAFFQQEWNLSRRWTAFLGGRLDDSRYHGISLTPRLGLIYRPSVQSALKFLYGRSFRDPNANEQFYDDGISQISNPDLRPERMQTFEAVFERELGERLELSANAYHYRLGQLITAVPLDDAMIQYQNAALIHSTGLELEVEGRLSPWLKADASLALQRSSYSNNGYLGVNAPSRVGKFLLESPVFRQGLWLSGGLQYLSERRTLGGDAVPPVYLVNFTAASRKLPGGWEAEAGIHNLFNRRYWDPASAGQPMDRIEQDGRSFFVRITWSPQSKQKPRAASRTRLAPAQ